MNNKVKFNICNCHYALQKVQENGEMAFENPVAMPGAVSIALDPNGEPESFYADGIEYYIIANNMGYDGDLERNGCRYFFRIAEHQHPLRRGGADADHPFRLCAGGERRGE